MLGSSIFVLALMAEAATAPLPQDKLICRRMPITGSAFRTNRVCHTKAEWEKLRDDARRDTEYLQQPKNGTNAG